MKKITFTIIAVLGISSLKAQQFKLLDAQENQLVVEHHLQTSPYNFTHINGKDHINFGKTYKVTTLQKGAPQMPTFSESVVVPSKGNVTLAVEYDSFYELSDVFVSPSKGNLKRNIDPSNIPYEFGEAYSQDAFYPGNLAVASDPFILRELRGQTVTFYPYQYNPVTKKLRIYENLRVRVVTSTTQTGINEITVKTKKGQFQGMFNDHFLNGDLQAKYTPKGEEGDLLIICSDALAESIMPLVKWKTQKGIKTTVVSTSVTGTTDAAIKSYIQDFYNANSNLLYLLLVGDHADIPAHTYGMSGSEELWSDSYYGQLSGSDYYPELFVGRLSGNEANITTMVERGLEYEKNPAAGDWMTKAAGLGSGEGAGYGDDGEADWQHLRNIRTKLLGFGYSEVHEFYDGSRGQADAAGDPNSAIIVPAVNNGIGLLNYTGHGDLNLCVTGNFTSTHVNSATNNGKYPFVVSVACNNGTFTYGTCISEAWLRAKKNGTPSGAIAACGSSILMAWAQPMQTQDELAELIAESYANNRKSTLGGLFYNAQMSMLEEYPGMDGREVMQTWVFFGDPSVEFRNKETMELTANHVNQVPQTTSSLTVSCNTENALVAVSQDGILLGKGTVSGGTATISFPMLTSDLPLTVTATKQNYNVYQKNVQVGNGPLGIDNLEIDELAIYPNPADGQLNIVFKANGDQSFITLFDLTGKAVRNISVSASGITKTTMETYGIAPGIYQVVIESGNKRSNSKIVIR